MLLDQQYPMEHAFRGPAKVLDRFGTLEPARDRRGGPRGVRGAVLDAAGDPPVPGSMATRLQELARIVEDEYDGHAERIWTEAADGPRPAQADAGAAGLRQAEGADLRGPAGQAARRTPGRGGAAVGAYAEDGYRSVADVVDGASLQKVRDFKKEKKAAAKAQAG